MRLLKSINLSEVKHKTVNETCELSWARLINGLTSLHDITRVYFFRIKMCIIFHLFLNPRLRSVETKLFFSNDCLKTIWLNCLVELFRYEFFKYLLQNSQREVKLRSELEEIAAPSAMAAPLQSTLPRTTSFQGAGLYFNNKPPAPVLLEVTCTRGWDRAPQKPLRQTAKPGQATIFVFARVYSVYYTRYFVIQNC